MCALCIALISDYKNAKKNIKIDQDLRLTIDRPFLLWTTAEM